MRSMALLTNEEFAARVGIHYSTASRLRSGERHPSLELFAEIARIYRFTNQEIADALEAYRRGRYHDFLNEKVFGPE